MKHFIFTITLLTICTTNLIAQTTLTFGERSATNIDFMEANKIRDTTDINQDPTPFTKNIELMSADEQLEYDRMYPDLAPKIATTPYLRDSNFYLGTTNLSKNRICLICGVYWNFGILVVVLLG